MFVHQQISTTAAGLSTTTRTDLFPTASTSSHDPDASFSTSIGVAPPTPMKVENLHQPPTPSPLPRLLHCPPPPHPPARINASAHHLRRRCSHVELDDMVRRLSNLLMTQTLYESLRILIAEPSRNLLQVHRRLRRPLGPVHRCLPLLRRRLHRIPLTTI